MQEELWLVLLVLTQPLGLGWDMAAPLALSKGKGRSRFPAGMTSQKGNSKCKDNNKGWVPIHDGLIVMGGHPKPG